MFMELVRNWLCNAAYRLEITYDNIHLQIFKNRGLLQKNTEMKLCLFSFGSKKQNKTKTIEIRWRVKEVTEIDHIWKQTYICVNY